MSIYADARRWAILSDIRAKRRPADILKRNRCTVDELREALEYAVWLSHRTRGVQRHNAIEASG